MGRQGSHQVVPAQIHQAARILMFSGRCPPGHRRTVRTTRFLNTNAAFCQGQDTPSPRKIRAPFRSCGHRFSCSAGEVMIHAAKILMFFLNSNGCARIRHGGEQRQLMENHKNKSSVEPRCPLGEEKALSAFFTPCKPVAFLRPLMGQLHYILRTTT